MADNAHTNLVRAALVELSSRGHLAWDNQTGAGWVGKFITRTAAGRTILDSARPISFGLPGSADIIGVLQGGLPLAAEAKTGTGRQRKNQQAFQAAWEKRGGIYVVFHSVDELIGMICDRIAA
ncbi:hypothetical protein [Sphingomonas sp. PB4P5]|uniref:hypothetical protein n=1 Tax=Parasphingomonas puruogangriensis TaxID=3096155 RepID=UPI002FC8B3CB